MEGAAELMADRCDFCSNFNPSWTYPAGDFIIASDGVGSKGAWAACDDCHAMIADEDRDALAAWSLKTFIRKNGKLPSGAKPLIAQRIRELHDQFWQERRGTPYKNGTPFDGETQRSTQ